MSGSTGLAKPPPAEKPSSEDRLNALMDAVSALAKRVDALTRRDKAKPPASEADATEGEDGPRELAADSAGDEDDAKRSDAASCRRHIPTARQTGTEPTMGRRPPGLPAAS